MDLEFKGKLYHKPLLQCANNCNGTEGDKHTEENTRYINAPNTTGFNDPSENIEKRYIVGYDSVSGFTKQYAQWIAQDLNAACVPICDVNNQLLLSYQCVIIGGHVRYENLSHRRKIAKLIEGHDNAILFVVGASPTADRLAVGSLMRRIYKSMPQFKYVPHFYFQGGLNYDLVPKYERFLLRTLTTIWGLRLKLNLLHSQKEKECYERMKASFNATNRARTDVLVEYARQ